jgi:hypothetical protein
MRGGGGRRDNERRRKGKHKDPKGIKRIRRESTCTDAGLPPGAGAARGQAAGSKLKDPRRLRGRRDFGPKPSCFHRARGRPISSKNIGGHSDKSVCKKLLCFRYTQVFVESPPEKASQTEKVFWLGFGKGFACTGALVGTSMVPGFPRPAPGTQNRPQ